MSTWETSTSTTGCRSRRPPADGLGYQRLEPASSHYRIAQQYLMEYARSDFCHIAKHSRSQDPDETTAGGKFGGVCIRHLKVLACNLQLRQARLLIHLCEFEEAHALLTCPDLGGQRDGQPTRFVPLQGMDEHDDPADCLRLIPLLIEIECWHPDAKLLYDPNGFCGFMPLHTSVPLQSEVTGPMPELGLRAVDTKCEWLQPCVAELLAGEYYVLKGLFYSSLGVTMASSMGLSMGTPLSGALRQLEVIADRQFKQPRELKQEQKMPCQHGQTRKSQLAFLKTEVVAKAIDYMRQAKANMDKALALFDVQWDGSEQVIPPHLTHTIGWANKLANWTAKLDSISLEEEMPPPADLVDRVGGEPDMRLRDKNADLRELCAAAQHQIATLQEPVQIVIRQMLTATLECCSNHEKQKVKEPFIKSLAPFEFDPSKYLCPELLLTEHLPASWLECDMAELRQACASMHQAVLQVFQQWASSKAINSKQILDDCELLARVADSAEVLRSHQLLSTYPGIAWIVSHLIAPLSESCQTYLPNALHVLGQAQGVLKAQRAAMCSTPTLLRLIMYHNPKEIHVFVLWHWLHQTMAKRLRDTVIPPSALRGMMQELHEHLSSVLTVDQMQLVAQGDSPASRVIIRDTAKQFAERFFDALPDRLHPMFVRYPLQAMLAGTSGPHDNIESPINDAFCTLLQQDWWPLNDKYKSQATPLQTAIDHIEKAQRSARGFAAMGAFCPIGQLDSGEQDSSVEQGLRTAMHFKKNCHLLLEDRLNSVTGILNRYCALISDTEAHNKWVSCVEENTKEYLNFEVSFRKLADTSDTVDMTMYCDSIRKSQWRVFQTCKRCKVNVLEGQHTLPCSHACCDLTLSSMTDANFAERPLREHSEWMCHYWHNAYADAAGIKTMARSSVEEEQYLHKLFNIAKKQKGEADLLKMSTSSLSRADMSLSEFTKELAETAYVDETEEKTMKRCSKAVVCGMQYLREREALGADTAFYSPRSDPTYYHDAILDALYMQARDSVRALRWLAKLARWQGLHFVSQMSEVQGELWRYRDHCFIQGKENPYRDLFMPPIRVSLPNSNVTRDVTKLQITIDLNEAEYTCLGGEEALTIQDSTIPDDALSNEFDTAGGNNNEAVITGFWLLVEGDFGVEAFQVLRMESAGNGDYPGCKKWFLWVLAHAKAEERQIDELLADACRSGTVSLCFEPDECVLVHPTVQCVYCKKTRWPSYGSSEDDNWICCNGFNDVHWDEKQSHWCPEDDAVHFLPGIMCSKLCLYATDGGLVKISNVVTNCQEIYNLTTEGTTHVEHVLKEMYGTGHGTVAFTPFLVAKAAIVGCAAQMLHDNWFGDDLRHARQELRPRMNRLLEGLHNRQSQNSLYSRLKHAVSTSSNLVQVMLTTETTHFCEEGIQSSVLQRYDRFLASCKVAYRSSILACQTAMEQTLTQVHVIEALFGHAFPDSSDEGREEVLADLLQEAEGFFDRCLPGVFSVCMKSSAVESNSKKFLQVITDLAYQAATDRITNAASTNFGSKTQFQCSILAVVVGSVALLHRESAPTHLVREIASECCRFQVNGIVSCALCGSMTMLANYVHRMSTQKDASNLRRCLDGKISSDIHRAAQAKTIGSLIDHVKGLFKDLERKLDNQMGQTAKSLDQQMSQIGKSFKIEKGEKNEEEIVTTAEVAPVAGGLASHVVHVSSFAALKLADQTVVSVFDRIQRELRRQLVGDQLLGKTETASLSPGYGIKELVMEMDATDVADDVLVADVLRSQLSSEICPTDALLAFLESCIDTQQTLHQGGDLKASTRIELVLDCVSEVALELASYAESSCPSDTERLKQQIEQEVGASQGLISELADVCKYACAMKEQLEGMCSEIPSQYPLEWALHACQNQPVDFRTINANPFPYDPVSAFSSFKQMQRDLSGQQVLRVSKQLKALLDHRQNLLREIVVQVLEPVFWQTQNGLVDLLENLESELAESDKGRRLHDAFSMTEAPSIHMSTGDAGAMQEHDPEREVVLLKMQLAGFLQLAKQSMTRSAAGPGPAYQSPNIRWSHAFLGLLPPWSCASSSFREGLGKPSSFSFQNEFEKSKPLLRTEASEHAISVDCDVEAVLPWLYHDQASSLLFFVARDGTRHVYPTFPSFQDELQVSTY